MKAGAWARRSASLTAGTNIWTLGRSDGQRCTLRSRQGFSVTLMLANGAENRSPAPSGLPRRPCSVQTRRLADVCLLPLLSLHDVGVHSGGGVVEAGTMNAGAWDKCARDLQRTFALPRAANSCPTLRSSVRSSLGLACFTAAWCSCCAAFFSCFLTACCCARCASCRCRAMRCTAYTCCRVGTSCNFIGCSHCADDYCCARCRQAAREHIACTNPTTGCWCSLHHARRRHLNHELVCSAENQGKKATYASHLFPINPKFLPSWLSSTTVQSYYSITAACLSTCRTCVTADVSPNATAQLFSPLCWLVSKPSPFVTGVSL